MGDLYGMSEAECITDYGDLAIMDYMEEYIDNDRNRRLRSLVGKYVIVCDSRRGKGLLYLQDQTISVEFKGHHWTTFMSNARGFTDYTQARIKCGNLRYNDPRVRYVDNNFSLKIPRDEVRRDGR